MNKKDVGNIKNSKRGRKPKANPQTNRYQIRLSGKDTERFLAMYKRSGKRSISAFMADCVLNNPMKMVFIDKTLIDFTILLSSFHTQFRGIKNNFNQVYETLVLHLGEERATEMIHILFPSTRAFGLLKQEIEETITRLRELCLPR